MATLAFSSLYVAASPFGPQGSLALAGPGAMIRDGHWDDPRPELTGLLPYRPIASYSRDPGERPYRAAVLENEHLRAVFLPDLGGRLWSLTDKSTGLELLHQPDFLQPANLAVRNAWIPGGVEWNLGVRGHWALTVDPVFAGSVDSDSGPVLRLWEFERRLGVTWRIDAFLPPQSRVLLVRPVVINDTGADLPVYWWSNSGVPQVRGGRVLVPADRAWCHTGDSGQLRDLPLPRWEGRDVTRPDEARESIDYFFRVRPERPWIAAVRPDGGGLIQASTNRLGGRKLFVWGETPGGRHWQDWLSGSGRYFEIQAGLAPTQFDYQRLPAGQTWAWTEAYGCLPPRDARCGDAPWEEALASVDADLEQLLAGKTLADWDRAAAHWQDEAPHQLDSTGVTGWGALEVAAGHRAPRVGTPYPFETLGEDQRPWLALLRTKTLPEQEEPPVPVAGWDWIARLEPTAATWSDWLSLGLLWLSVGETQRGMDALRASLSMRPTGWAHYYLSLLEESEAAQAHLRAAHGFLPDSAQVTLALVASLAGGGQHRDCLTFIESLPEGFRQMGRIRYWTAWCLAHLGQVPAALRLLDEGIEIPDLREGELSFTDLWNAIGAPGPLPARYDFKTSSSPADEVLAGALHTTTPERKQGETQ